MKYRNELKFLKDIGCDKLPHKNGSLYDHLVATAKLLIRFKRSDDEVICGLFHSIYGTTHYKHSKKLNITRNQIRSLVGNTAEELIHKFCSLGYSREEVLEEDKFDKTSLEQLRWVAYCNEIEQSTKYKPWTKKLEQLLKVDMN